MDILAKQRGSSFNTSIPTVDQDIAAKQQGRATDTTPAKPGAYIATCNVSSGNGSADLRGFELDILAKQRGSSFNTSIPTVDQDIAAKQQGRATGATSAKPGAHIATCKARNGNDSSDLRDFEAAVLAKQHGNSFDISHSTIDQGIATKQQFRTTDTKTIKPSGYVATSTSRNDNDRSDLRCTEADILAEQRGSSFIDEGLANMNFLERDIVETKLIFNDGQTIDSVASELLQLDADIAAKRDALVSLSPSTSYVRSDDTARELKQNILALMSEGGNENNRNIMDSPSKQTGSTLRQRACVDESSIGNSISKNVPAESAVRNEDLQGLEYGEYSRNDEKGLAVAFAVEEDNADTYLPSAVEFDPDAKPSMHRNRRFRLYVCLMLAATVVGTFGAGLGLMLTSGTRFPPESLPYRATLGIRENLARVVSPEQLDDYNSPYKKALDWITFIDPMALTPDNARFLNRFVLAYFYFATSQKRPWDSDCAPSDTEQYECMNSFLKDAESKNFENKTSFRWLSEISECEWAGIGCDSFNQIRSIGLSKYCA